MISHNYHSSSTYEPREKIYNENPPTYSNAPQKSNQKQQTKRVLLDLPYPILEKILYEVTLLHPRNDYSQCRPPRSLLQIAATCKTLRDVTATLLSSNETWTSSLFTSCISLKKTVKCPYLSDDLNEQISITQEEPCTANSCTPFHQLSAWYRLVIPRLQYFAFSSVWESLATREVFSLVCQLVDNKVQLNKLQLTFSTEFATDHHVVVQSLMQLVHVAYNSLQELCISTAYSHVPDLVNILCSKPLSSIRSIDFVMNSQNPHKDMEILCNILKHCRNCGATIRSLSLTAEATHFETIDQLSEYSSSLQNLVLISSVHGKPFGFPKAANLSSFNLKSLVIRHTSIDEDEMKELVEYAVAQDNLSDIRLYSSNVKPLGRHLQGYKQKLGKKIKSLDTFTCDPYDSALMFTVADFCFELKEVYIAYQVESVDAVRTLLRNSKYLKVVHLKEITMRNPHHLIIDDIASGLLECVSPIEEINLVNGSVALNENLLWKLVDRYAKTLVKFTLIQECIDPRINFQGLKRVMVHILDNEDIVNLESFSIPIRPWPRGWCEDDQLLLQEIMKLCNKIQMRCKKFTISDFF